MWADFLAGVRDVISVAASLDPAAVRLARDETEAEFREAGAFDPWLSTQMEGISVEFVERCLAALTNE